MTSNSLTESPVEIIKNIRFYSKDKNDETIIEISIPELLQPGYSFYIWPAANVLAWFLYIHRENFINKRILEIGCGTALPGILASKLGADVTLSDCLTLPNTIKHIHRCCKVNHLEPGRDIQVIGLTWGLLLKSAFEIGPLDYIISADCFYDPTVFEEILVTVSFLLNNSSDSNEIKFLFTYQERSSDWSIEHLLKKWNLKCHNVSLNQVETSCPIEIDQLMNDHTIRLLEITKN